MAASRESRILGDTVQDVFTVVGFALPVIAYFVFVSHYSVNTVLGDQWNDVALIEKAFSGHLRFGDLWAQHNENRMFFPNLVVLALGYTTHLDIRTEAYLSALLLTGSVAIVVFAHHRRSPTTPLLWYVPIAILMFSWAQYQNTLWGFQIAWYMVMICLVGSLALLDREALSPWLLAAAIAVAVIGSFSSLQGLFIWPSALVLLLYRRRQWKHVVVWVGAAAVCAGLYFYNFDFSQLGFYSVNPLTHPVFVTKVFFFGLGNIAGHSLAVPVYVAATHTHPWLGTASPWVILFGFVIFACAVLAVVRAGFHRSEGAEPFGVAVVVFALLFAASTATGRSLYGYSGVSLSKYASLNLLVLVGSYLVMVSRPSRWGVRWITPAFRKALPIATAGVVGVAIVFGYVSGRSGAHSYHQELQRAAELARNYRSEGTEVALLDPPTSPAATDRMIQIGQGDHLSSLPGS